MNDFLSVGIPDRVRDSAHEVHPRIDAELVAALLKIVVEPNGTGVEIEDKRRPKLALNQLDRSQNSRMDHPRKNFVFALRGPEETETDVMRRGGPNWI